MPELIAGERLSAGSLAYVGDDGRLYLAHVIAGGKTAVGYIVKQDIAEGEIATWNPDGHLIRKTVEHSTEPSSERAESWRDRPPML